MNHVNTLITAQKLSTVAGTIFTPVKLLPTYTEILSNKYSFYLSRRRNAVKQNLNSNKNVPIRSIIENIFVLSPTESPASPIAFGFSSQTCSYNRVFQKAKQAKIHFSNGATVTIQISPHKLSQQLWKAGYVLSPNEHARFITLLINRMEGSISLPSILFSIFIPLHYPAFFDCLPIHPSYLIICHFRL